MAAANARRVRLHLLANWKKVHRKARPLAVAHVAAHAQALPYGTMLHPWNRVTLAKAKVASVLNVKSAQTQTAKPAAAAKGLTVRANALRAITHVAPTPQSAATVSVTRHRVSHANLVSHANCVNPVSSVSPAHRASRSTMTTTALTTVSHAPTRTWAPSWIAPLRAHLAAPAAVNLTPHAPAST